MPEPLVRIEDLAIRYPSHYGVVQAADVSRLEIRKGEVLGLVGESGCGKSTLGMALLRMVREPGYIAGGHIWFDGEDLVSLSESETLAARLAALSVPAFYIAGSPGGIGTRSLELLENAGVSCTLIAPAGHVPFFEQPDHFTRTLLSMVSPP